MLILDKHEYISKVCDIVAEKSTCGRARVGCVFVNKDYEILATGYNGSPRKFDHCGNDNHLIEDGHCVRTVHAEQNAIVQAAKNGHSLDGSICYVTHTPCFVCCKMLINLNVREVRIRQFYREKKTDKWFKKAKIKIKKWNHKS